MLAHSLTIDGTDIKSYISKYGLTELAPRKIYGPNTYTAASGKLVPDYIGKKYDITITLNPIKALDIPALVALFSGDTVTVGYWSSFLGSNVTRTMQHDISDLILGIQDAYKEVYEGLTITLTEL